MAELFGEFDFVVVGAGSAGCVLANRLTEGGAASVALLEAGGRNRSLLVTMPAGVGELISTKNGANWAFETAPQPSLDNRRLWQPRGKGWGGSSAINGMIYIRGHARDYDQWRQMGLAGWGYRDVLPYFRKAEALESGEDAWHGADGPLWVSHPKSAAPVYRAFIKAARAAGYPYTKDFNGYQQEGAGPYQLTIKEGKRWSASAAYLEPALARPNLTEVSEARVRRVLFEKGRAIGVEFAQGPSAPARIVRARREVILCAGAFQSPHILMLSGIGPAAALAAAGIEGVLDRADVGQNLQDHLDVSVIHECPLPVSAYAAQKGWRKYVVGLDYMLRGQGVGRSNHLEAGAFLKTRAELDTPDIQLHLVNAIMIDHAKTRVEKDGFTLHACQLRPESRGEVRLAGPDPFAEPVIDPRYLSAERDRATMRDAVKICRTIFRQAPLDALRGDELRPGARVVTDAEIDAYIRATAETIYHPVGTCRMGTDDAAVLDASLKVRGINGLRVVDASAMPTLIGGNTNAPVIMMAEKAADMILGRAALAPEDAPIAEDRPGAPLAQFASV